MRELRTGAAAALLALVVAAAGCASGAPSTGGAAMINECLAQHWRRHVSHINGVPVGLVCAQAMTERQLRIDRAVAALRN